MRPVRLDLNFDSIWIVPAFGSCFLKLRRRHFAMNYLCLHTRIFAQKDLLTVEHCSIQSYHLMHFGRSFTRLLHQIRLNLVSLAKKFLKLPRVPIQHFVQKDFLSEATLLNFQMLASWFGPQIQKRQRVFGYFETATLHAQTTARFNYCELVASSPIQIELIVSMEWIPAIQTCFIVAT